MEKKFELAESELHMDSQRIQAVREAIATYSPVESNEQISVEESFLRTVARYDEALRNLAQ